MSIKKDLLKFNPRDEQTKALDYIKNVLDKKPDTKFFLLNMPVGVGKAQPLYSNVLTPSGWKKFGNLIEGDEIITPKGTISKICKLHDIHTLPIYKITFIDGREVECTEQHLWKIHHQDYRNKWKVMPLCDVIHKFNASYRNNLYVPLINSSITEDRELVIDPYVLGCLIGDGGLTEPSIFFTTKDVFIYEKLKEKLEKDSITITKLASKYGYYISYEIRDKLKKLELFGKKSEFKFIPEEYKNISYNQKIELLQGLIDTDGTVTKGGSIVFYSSSEKLAKDVQEMIWSIGGIASIKTKNKKYRNKNNELVNGLTSYDVCIRFSNMRNLVSLPRKLNRLSENYQYSDLKLRIKSIEKLNTEVETRCISIDDIDELYITDGYVVTHNSHLAVMVSDYITSKVLSGAKVDIITAGKLLQDQYENTYDEIKSLRGKDNYQCAQYSCSCEKGKEFNKLNKSKCDFCPYDAAKLSYMTSEVSLTNFHLYLINAVYGNSMMKDRDSRLLIVDECHELDTVMSDFISIKITETIIKKFKFSTENEIINQLKNVVNIETYIDFLKYFLEQIMNTMLEIESFLSSGRTGDKNSAKRDSRDMKINSILDIESNDVKFMELVSDLRQYSTKISVFINEYEQTPDNWVIESSYNEKLKSNELSLEPIWAKDYLEKFVWSRYDIVVLMSGTILDKKLFSDINGIDAEKAVYYSVPSPFLQKNRKVIYMPLGKMSFTKKEETFKKYIPFFEKLIKKYPSVKGIIHTNSFELSKWIENSVKDKRFIFHSSTNKEEMLKHHFTSKKPTIIVSPSVSTGVSFDNEKSRFQVIAKIPYPSLASQKNKMRQKTYPEWYVWRTICGVCQMMGRPIRNMNDYADTIIIDSCFGDILKYSSHYFPKWVLESITTVVQK